MGNLGEISKDFEFKRITELALISINVSEDGELWCLGSLDGITVQFNLQSVLKQVHDAIALNTTNIDVLKIIVSQLEAIAGGGVIEHTHKIDTIDLSGAIFKG